MAIGLFIDGAYVYKVFNDKIDFVKLRNHIETTLNDKIEEAYFFSADDDPPSAEKLHNALAYPPPTGPGFRLKIYWLQKKKLYWPLELGGQPVMHPTIADLQYEVKQQKAVDVGLIYHMTRSLQRKKWDKLVLAAGDSDFHEPVQNLVESENIELTLVGSLQTMSGELRPYAKRIIEINVEPLKSSLLLAPRTFNNSKTTSTKTKSDDTSGEVIETNGIGSGKILTNGIPQKVIQFVYNDDKDGTFRNLNVGDKVKFKTRINKLGTTFALEITQE